MDQPLSPEIDKLIRDLQPDRAFVIRKSAVAQLGQLGISNREIVDALLKVTKTDSSFEVVKAAREALRNPAHQEILQQDSDLLKRAPGTQAPRPSPSSPEPAPQRLDAAQRTPITPKPYALSTPPTRDYAVLRSIASLSTGLAWFIAALSGLYALAGLIAMAQADAFLGLAIIASAVILGGFSFIVLRVIAEGISVILDIETSPRQVAQNTQRAAEILEQRLEQK